MLAARTDAADPSTESFEKFAIEAAEIDRPIDEIARLYLLPAFVTIREKIRSASNQSVP